jgi:mannose-1-phosphate guanylyltransferase/phosphomannomutase
VATVAKQRFKIVIDYSYGSASLMMPAVLSKLGAEVLAVNPYVSTSGAIEYDPATQAAAVAELVRASGAGLGAVIDPHGEHIGFVDDDGTVLSAEQAVALFVELISRQRGGTIALTVAASRSLVDIAERNGASVTWTKTSTASLQEAASVPGVTFAAGLDGGLVVPDFLSAFDAAAALVKLLELLARDGRSLSEIVGELPTGHVVHDTVGTPSDVKGVVMRRVMEQTAGMETDLIDGVKVQHDGGWVLVLPDPEEPVTHVWAEGRSGRESRRLLQDYVRRIRQAVR